MELEEAGKRAVGRAAVDAYVRGDTCIGLGSGTTVVSAIDRVGELVREGMRLRVVPTSAATAGACRAAGIPLVALGDEAIDVAIDGADEVAPDWSLIKGGGGALFREKAVALAARRFVVIVTARKLVPVLGAFRLPVEVVPFSTAFVVREIVALGANVEIRRDGEGKPLASDNGNAILDCDFGPIPAPYILDRILRELHGVVGTGLFVGLTSHVVVAQDDGSVSELAPPRANGRA